MERGGDEGGCPLSVFPESGGFIARGGLQPATLIDSLLKPHTQRTLLDRPVHQHVIEEI